ncbi:RiPP maturation radical SAM C-methyltransferase [Cellulosilyticum sp. I15G10I2]|uniref:RiPP maturation radical SAM C-methyltransferase n=1 Tax=Cellulosilyticum sp. I15G10I2 TaxID=1892843 RepID=UPI00085CDFDA|nr:RiPP maturation radical SAM C-methyltransferase [Cellulosilyticum sp. I15G10I2]
MKNDRNSFIKNNISDNKFEVCLVNMPYAEIIAPSLALSSLKVALINEGISTKVLYPNIWFAEEIGLEDYQLFSYVGKGDDMLIWDWTFSTVAFPEMKRNELEYLKKIFNSLKVYEQYPGEIKKFIKSCLKVKRATESFVEKTAKYIISTGAPIIGCTSTLRQHVSSIALLRKIKELDPSKITMIGGANCATDMGQETHRSFEWIDFVMSGEGEGIIATLCKNVLRNGKDIDVELLPPGVWGPKHREGNNYNKTGNTSIQKNYAVFYDLDKLPIPDFYDYFETLNQSSIRECVIPGIVLQTSRGCWWGQLHQCTFCGLNGVNICYRVKSPERVLRELRTLESIYKTNRIVVADNILDMKYFNDVLPRLAEDSKERWIFYETKANLNCSQVQMLKKSGVEWIEPGIESLHSKPLKLMNKGVKAWQNIQLLKWARQYGVRTYWNLIWGFPGEDDQWYLEMSRYVCLLEHFHPPARLIELLYHRYSIYYKEPEKYGIKLIPHPALAYIYPLSQGHLKNLTYSFFVEGCNLYEKNIDIETGRIGILELRRVIKEWIEVFWEDTKPILSMNDNGDLIDIVDTRRCAIERHIVLKGLSRYIYLLCEKAPKIESIYLQVKESFSDNLGNEEIAECINHLKKKRLAIEIDGRIVSLAIKGEPLDFPTWEQTPFGIIKEISHV